LKTKEKKETKEIMIEYAIPEYETKLDSYGKGRVHDLLAIATMEKKSLFPLRQKQVKHLGRQLIIA
jgi:hypothetical protein